MKTQIDDAGPAFPGEQGHIPDGTWNQTWNPGMSLRDWFAGQALTGLIASPMEHWRTVAKEGSALGETRCSESWAREAFEYADAMLAARKKTP